jgi:hypothetical protein
MVANATVGVTLFTTYGEVQKSLETLSGEFSLTAPFLAGAAGGAVQCILSVPLDNIMKSINTRDLIKQRYISQVLYNTLSILFPDSIRDSWRHLTRFLYRSLLFTACRDSLGFAMFFGVFEAIKTYSKDAISILFCNDTKTEHKLSFGVANIGAVIFAGGVAGVAYQSTTYPLDR